ncbi:MAG: NfeD family protein [Cardiobacteriaceae bacterium]|nr:NfeD family protein [Cardiobacteriaceae bacterium]
MFDPPFWNWLILTGIFMLIEVFTVSFFFLLWGLAALALVVITLLAPTLDWHWQCGIFAVLSLLVIPLWRVVVRRWQSNKNDTATQLNHRTSLYIGREFTLDTPIENGYGKLKIGDSLWTIKGENLPAGSTIVITGSEDNQLHYRKVSS